jgi:hypothetical protein
MKKIYATLLMTLSILTCHAQITKVDNMKEVFDFFEGADSKTLAIFDVDMVLVHPSEPALQMANIKRFGTICRSFLKNLTLEEKTVFFCLTTNISQPILVEECTPQLLRKLQNKGIPVMALTANITGSLGVVPDMQHWRYTSLCALGIDFARCAPFQESIVFDNLPPFRGTNAQYRNGVLCTNGDNLPKGDAFLAFVAKTGVTPEKIIFIDDRLSDLTSMKAAVQKLDRPVEYLGLHYAGAEKYPSEVISREEFEASWKKVVSTACEVN